jgi:hypothetical protein
MENNDKEVDLSKTTEDTLETSPEQSEALQTPDAELSIEDLKAKLEAEMKVREEVEQKNKQLYARLKKDKVEDKPAPNPRELSLSERERFELFNAGVRNFEDVEFLNKVARGTDTSLVDTLKDEDIQLLLKQRQAKRQAAVAAHSGKTSLGVNAKNGAQLLLDADKRELSDAELTKAIKAKYAPKQ